MPRHLRRFQQHQERIEDERKLAKLLLESGEEAPVKVGHATAGGDRDRLRGLPAVGRGVGGAIKGSDPLATAIANEQRTSRTGVRRPR